ncbi:MAG: RAD55 family ATPase [Halobacteriaceae archaeon]
MDRIPLGVSRLDGRIGGGAPSGSVVLLAGEAGAGARELIYTTAVMNALGRTGHDLLDLYYGDVAGSAVFPESVHYVSFTASESQLRREMQFTMDDELADAGLDGVEFADLSQQYFQLSPVPREWYTEAHGDIGDLGNSSERRDAIEALADYLDEHAGGSLMLVDSLTDLVGVRDREAIDWDDIVFLLKGLRRAARTWGGLILVHASSESLTGERLGDLMSSVDGTMLFEWETGGNERVRTMVVREFRGVLSQLEEEDIVRFETEIHEGGFDISDVRKIR